MPIYGTSFEDLSDEERSTVKRKPRAVHDEVVTDERGKRRFHGAFTGGFSAGYFNTVGSKDGWVPKTFKSSRESRADKSQYEAADFMDAEDFGEFGIASKRLRTKSDFSNSTSLPTEKCQLAWERSSFGPSTSGLNDSIKTALVDILKPITDSIGIRLMKKMGWRDGKGVGPSMSRRQLEKQKVLDAKGRGDCITFDEEAVREVEMVAPDVEFCPEDVTDMKFAQKDNVHGLGYAPLQESSVLAQNYGKVAAGLKASRSGKAIRGQAFGVGAYEDDDEDIYTSYDLSQYDFEVGGASSKNESSARFDCTFVLPTDLSKRSRRFFDVPKIPPGFRPLIKLQPESITKNLSEKVIKVGECLTPFQRAKFLGERDNSVLELLNEADRKYLADVRAKNASEKPFNDKEIRRQTNQSEPFEEEPLKNHRFKQFVQYLKRGIEFPQPAVLTRLEWEREKEDFQQALTPELRALLPEVSARQKPLAKVEFSQPIAQQLKSRFQSEVRAEEETTVEKSVKQHADHDRIQAIRMNMFGELTRLKYTWYPSKELCKRFNVPPPYPGSTLIGVPELQKRRQKDSSSMDINIVGKMGLPSTADELAQKKREAENNKSSSSDAKVSVQGDTVTINDKTGNAPFDLLRALFEEDSSDDSSDTESDEDNDNQNHDPASHKPSSLASIDNKVRSGDEISTVDVKKPTEKIITVMDLVEDDDVYGPKPPPDLQNSSASRTIMYDVVDNETMDNVKYSREDVRNSDVSSKKKKQKRKKHSSKKHHKESYRKEKHKKHSKHKRKTKDRTRESSVSSASSVEIIG